jgi:hypothetical protein
MTISAHGWADGELRIRVIDDRVDCPRLDSADIDRCRECAYLLRLEAAVTGASETHVVCLAASADFGLESAW